MASPDESEISALDSLVHSYEFENKNVMKMIEKENQTILELQAQSQQTANEAKRLSLVIPQLEENIKHLDKQYITMLDNIESQKKTKNLLADHELALTKQIEATRISTEEKSNFYKEQISNYTKVRDEYMEQYASLSLAVQLNAKKSELSEINKKLTEIQDKKREIKQLIQEKENYLDSHSLNRIVVQIAQTKLAIAKINEEITQVQAEKAASRELNAESHPAKLNLSQQHSQPDAEGDDMSMEIDTNCSPSDMKTEYSLLNIDKQNKISMDANTDGHDKVISNKTLGAGICSGSNDIDTETTVDSVEDEDFSMIETESEAPSSKPEVNSTGFSAQLPQGLPKWNQSNITKCFPKPSVPSTFAACTATTSAQFSSFALPSLPRLPTLRQFNKEQFIPPLSSQPSQITSNTQAKSENSFHFPSPQLPLKPVLHTEQLFRGFEEGRKSTASQFQNRTAHTKHNVDPDSNVNNAQSFTSFLSQKPALPSLQKEVSTANVNESRANTFHQFLKPSASILQNDQSKSQNIRNTMAFQFQKPVTPSSAMEESNRPGRISATPVQLQKLSVPFDLPSSNLPTATSVTPDRFKVSTPRLTLKPFQLPVAQFKPQPPPGTGNNERMVKGSDYQKHADVVKAKKLPQSQGFQSAFPRVPNQLVAPAPTSTSAIEAPSISTYKLSTQVNETAPQESHIQLKQPQKSSTFSFLLLKTSDHETTLEQMPSPQNTTPEDNAPNYGAGFLRSYTFDEPADNATYQTDQPEFSLTMLESSKTNSSKSGSGTKPQSNEMFNFGLFNYDNSDTEDNEPPMFSTILGNSFEPDKWGQFGDDNSPLPDANRLLFSDN